jgi:hypothetical protein
MKRNISHGLGGAVISATLIASFIAFGSELARADEPANPGAQEIVILDGPEVLGPPAEPVLPPPPREDAPSLPTPAPSETPILNPGFEPQAPVIDAPRESPVQPVAVAPIQISESTQQQTVPETTSATEANAELAVKPAVDANLVVSKPQVIALPPRVVSVPIAAGTLALTASAKATLAKTAAAVKASNGSISISVRTAGTTVARATAQANAMVAELKKRGVSAVTVIKRVGNKTSVSVLVTKKR